MICVAICILDAYGVGVPFRNPRSPCTMFPGKSRLPLPHVYSLIHTARSNAQGSIGSSGGRTAHRIDSFCVTMIYEMGSTHRRIENADCRVARQAGSDPLAVR